MVNRVLVTKKTGFDVEAQHLCTSIKEFLGINIDGVKIVNRYDLEDIEASTLEAAKVTVLSEPPVDDIIDELPAETSC